MSSAVPPHLPDFWVRMRPRVLSFRTSLHTHSLVISLSLRVLRAYGSSLFSSPDLSHNARLLCLLTIPTWMSERNSNLASLKSRCGVSLHACRSYCLPLSCMGMPFHLLDLDANLWSHASSYLCLTSHIVFPRKSSLLYLPTIPRAQPLLTTSRLLSCSEILSSCPWVTTKPSSWSLCFLLSRSLLFLKMAARMIISKYKLDHVRSPPQHLLISE